MKRFIAFFIICSFLTAAVFYNQPKRYPDGNYRLNILKYMATAGRDSVFTLSFDSLKQYLRNQGFSDTLSLIDTLAALKVRTSTQIHDSLGQALVVIPNDIKIKGNDLTFGNGASISNASADTARVTETAVKIEGKLVNFNDYVSHSIATNTILGITAGENLTSGFSNTFTGEQAGKNVTTGYVNSFYGAEAGKSLTTGIHNNLVGYYAGARITTGKYNNFFGSETGSMLKSGEHNTIMGHHAMLGTLGDAGTAGFNTAIGANSCYKVATGVYNATLGFRAMGSGDGNFNTMLGAYTGHSNPGNIGDRNVFIGYRAGSECLTASDSLIIASGDGEIFKGSFADSSLIATGKFTIEGNDLIFGNGASISNASADTARVTETAVKIEGKLVNFNDYVSHSIATNTILGITAGENLTSGSGNAALGYRAMGSGDGNYNTMLGCETGYSNPGNIGDRNVFIGHRAGSGCLTASDSLIIASDDWVDFDADSLRLITVIKQEIFKGSFADSSLIATGKFTIEGDELAFGSGASITNPSSGILSLNSGIVSIPSDSTYAGQVLHADTTKTNVIILPNNAVVSNVHADSLRLIEANTIIDGNLKVNGTQTTLKNGITFTTYGDSLAIAGGNYLTVRTPFNVNPYISAYTGATYGWRFSNTLIGVHSGKSGMTGNHNICIGDSTGISLTSGHKNVFIGGLSGLSNTTGYYNTFNGYAAGYSNTTGANNTFSGSLAGRSNTTGYYNVFSGCAAGYANTTGYNNTFNGYVSGRSNTTGYNNTFNGYAAGLLNTTGYNNVFNGYAAGYSNTTGYNNTFNGYQAGRLNTAGAYNTFNGYQAGHSNTTGYYNVFNGYAAGYSNTTGSYNIAFGDSSGVTIYNAGVPKTNTAPLLTSRNVLIGHRACPLDSTSNDNFILQNDNGSNVQRLMQGSFADSSLTINGNISYKKPFGEFHRIYTQTPANPNVWENIRWNEKHAETTSHFTATADSQGVIISKAGIYAVRCVSKMLWTGSAATTVSSYFRLWQGKGAAITKELRTSQHTSVEEKNTSNANDEFFWGSRYFAAGDTVYAQWRTSNVGNLIRGSAIFANPTSASIVIEYIKER